MLSKCTSQMVSIDFEKFIQHYADEKLSVYDTNIEEGVRYGCVLNNIL